MTLLEHDDAPVDATGRGVAARRAGRLRRVVGAVVTAAGICAWFGWLAWRMAGVTTGFSDGGSTNVVGIVVLMLELVAFAAALVVTAGLCAATPPRRRDRRRSDGGRQLPLLLAEALDVGAIIDESVADGRIGGDDTGEIAWARRGIRLLGDHRRAATRAAGVREAAWSVVAVDGLRRCAAIVVLLVVLFSGATPFAPPTAGTASLLLGGVALVAIGHWVLSAGHVRPGARLVWSMSSIGAGIGPGISRSGLPIRWATTMATLVALNIAIALRGISDRWTHGLGPMDRDARVVAMSVALWFVMAGYAALARMPRPDGGFYGATRRLEEPSVRRLALGLTMVVALVGFGAGALPEAVAVAVP